MVLFSCNEWESATVSVVVCANPKRHGPYDFLPVLRLVFDYNGCFSAKAFMAKINSVGSPLV
jgi:hypothetical protein